MQLSTQSYPRSTLSAVQIGRFVTGLAWGLGIFPTLLSTSVTFNMVDAVGLSPVQELNGEIEASK